MLAFRAQEGARATSVVGNGPIADRNRPTISSGIDNDLTELPILHEAAMGIDHFAEREGSIE
jgi:hypothetical protein